MMGRIGIFSIKVCFLLSLAFSSSVFAKDKVSIFFENLKTLTADFEQVVENAQLGSASKASGKLWIQRPGKFRWDYITPYAQEIVSDGEKLWVFDTDLEQVIVKSISSSMGNTPAVLLSDTKPIVDTFNIKDLGLTVGSGFGSKGQLHWIELTPKDPEASFTGIRLGFEGEIFREMLLVDNLGQTTRLNFSNLKRNDKISAQKFIFTPPKGVDIFESGESGE